MKRYFISLITTRREGCLENFVLGYNNGCLICSEFATKYFKMPVRREKHFKVSLSTQPFKGSKEIKLAPYDSWNVGWVPKGKEHSDYIYNNLQEVLKEIGATKRVFVKIETTEEKIATIT